MYQKGLSPQTIASYGWHLFKFGIWLSKQNIPIDRITPKELIHWGAILRHKYSAATNKLGVTAARGFVRHMMSLSVCNQFDVKNALPIPSPRSVPQRTLTDHEIGRIFSVCEGDSIKQFRDRAILALLLDAGLRADELCKIMLRDIDHNRRRVLVIGKGVTKEYAYYSETCSGHIKAWLERRPLCDNKFLFISIGGTTPMQRITTRGLRTIVKRLGEIAGISGVHPHAFRRSFATLRIKRGQSTRSVQRLGRWKNLATFERYTLTLEMDSDFASEQASKFSPLKSIS